MNDANAFVAQGSAGPARGYIAFTDVQICAANGCLGHFDDSVGWGRNVRDWTVLKRDSVVSCVNESFHSG
jgi:hypothetical protein